MRKSAITLEPEMRPKELKLLKETLKMRKFKGKHLEIGTAAGGTLVEILACLGKGGGEKVVVVDTMNYFPRQREIVEENILQHGYSLDAVDFRCKSSHQAFEEAEKAGESFDFILIDACHKFPYVVEDLRWSRLLKPGGILAMHDVSNKHWDVKLAANLFLKCHPEYQVYRQEDSLLLMEKKRECRRPEIRRLNLLLAKCSGPLFQLRRSLKKRIS